MDRRAGLSCYGLVREVYRYLQIELPRRDAGVLDEALVAAEGRNWQRIDAPEPYCVALIETPRGYHLAVVTADMRLLHSREGAGVVLSSIAKYAPRIVGWYRYAPPARNGEWEKRGNGETAHDESLSPLSPILPFSPSPILVPLPQGGIDGGRAIGGILVALAAVAAAVITGGAGIPALGIGGLGLGPLAGAMAGMAVSMAGSMIINAIAPLPSPETLPGNVADDSRTYTWGGMVNEFRQGLVKPAVFGLMKAGGQIISEKTWYTATNKEYLDELICPCTGPLTRIREIYINDTEIANFPLVEYEIREGDDEQDVMDAFDEIAVQYGSGARIPYDPSATDPVKALIFTSKAAIEGARLCITAPQGIFFLVDGQPTAKSVNVRIQYRAHDAASWTDHLSDAYAYGDEIPCFDRTSKTFTGTANPYYVNDTFGETAGSYHGLAEGVNFELIKGGTTYYCTVVTCTSWRLTFDCYTDAGRTTAKTGSLGTGAYTIQGEAVTVAKTGYEGSTAAHGFDTDSEVQAVRFSLAVPATTKWHWLKVDVAYKTDAAGSYTALGTYEFGDAANTDADVSGSVEIEIPDLASDIYYVRLSITDNTYYLPLTYTPGVNDFRIDNLAVSTSLDYHTLTADNANPTQLVSLMTTIESLTKGRHDFRFWRTTKDETSVYWQDDIYLQSYAEMLDAALSYPNHALIGLRMLANDRLSGGRPAITALLEGPPLTVPQLAQRVETTVYDDLGAVEASDHRIALLLHGDGDDESTDIADGSVHNHTVTPHGGAAISTDQSVFGGSSIYLDGAGDYLTIPTHSAFNFEDNDFTIEWWEYRPAVSLGPVIARADETYPPFNIGMNGLVYMSSNGAAWDIASGRTLGAVSLNTWVHKAVSREGKVFRTFSDGVKQDEWRSEKPLAYSEEDLIIGNKGTYYCRAYIDELAIHSYAKYTADFTPPVAAYASGNVVNGICVDGLRMIALPLACLPDPDDAGYEGTQWWMVLTDESGYAQADRLLTKRALRVVTWRIVSGGGIFTTTRCYVRTTEAIPVDTPVMLFNDQHAPTGNLAWVTAKLLLDGSHGRIQAANIDWASFAAWDEWLEHEIWV
jgi:hypothetical protein